MTNTAALEARNIRHGFGGTDVLHGVSLEVKSGEVVAVMGPSGSGKSTLLHLLGGLDVPKSGEVWWVGERVDVIETQKRAVMRAGRLGLVFQHHYLLEDLTVLQNVMVAGMLCGRDSEQNARDLLRRLGLGGLEKEMPSALSGGERQRASVARALAAGPAVLLADEPTGSLDRANAQEVSKLLLELARESGTGVLLVTHDDRLAEQADRILNLLDGHFTQA